MPIPVIVYCSSGSSLNATWPQTLAGTSGTYTCAAGYHASNPLVLCSQNGSVATWGANPCQPVLCPVSTYRVQNECISCPPNTQSPVDSTQLGNCTCLPGYQLQNGQCQRMSLSFSFLPSFASLVFFGSAMISIYI